MTYNINLTNNGVSLNRPSTQQARKIDLYTVLCCTVLALGAFSYISSVGIDNIEGSTPPILLLVGIGGTIIFSIRAMTKGLYLKQFPDRVFFNNDKAMIEINHTASVAKRIEIPYASVNHIAPRLHTRRDANRRSSSWYSVAIYLKDGSIWELSEDSHSHQDYAQQWIDQWAPQINLNTQKPVNITLPKTVSEKLSITNRGEEVQIQWQNSFPDGALGKLVPPIIYILFVGFMGMTLMFSEGPDWDTLTKGLREMQSINELPDVLRGFMFVLPLMSICFVWLIIVIVIILRFRFTSNKLIATKNSVTHKDIRLEFKKGGVVCMEYRMKDKQRSIQFLKQVFHQYTETKSETVNINPEEFKQNNSTKEILNFFKESITSLPKMIREAQEFADAVESNQVYSIDFDRFSPVDVYVIKESIGLKLAK